MSIEQRRYIRFSMAIPAIRAGSDGSRVATFIRQISVGGCLAEVDEKIAVGDTFRLELVLPNKNRLPVFCLALYKFQGGSIGSKFVNMTKFERDLLAQIISQSLEDDGLPLLVDPFATPPTFKGDAEAEDKNEIQRLEAKFVEDILNSE